MISGLLDPRLRGDDYSNIPELVQESFRGFCGFRGHKDVD
jgi:hypothetical protein